MTAVQCKSINEYLMFKKNEGDTFGGNTWEAGTGDTIIAPAVKVEGDFYSEGNVTIEGSVKGTVATLKDLVVGEKAKILADVTASNALVTGEIRGNITIENQLELRATARVWGDVRAKVLIIAAGAELNGHCAMGAEPETAPVTKEKRERVKRNETVGELA